MALLRPHRGQVPRRLIAALGGIAVAAAGFAGGCNIVAPIAYAIEGPGMIPAQHELMRERTAVLVDDPTNRLPRTALRVELGESVGIALLERDLVPEVVATRDVVAFVRGNERDGTPIAMEKVAAGVGADQLLYLDVAEFSLVDRNGSPRPTATIWVRVLDIEGRTRTFPGPEEPRGVEVTAQLREVSPDLYRTPSSRRAIEEALIARAGVEIAKLFYEHDRVDLGENLGPR
ncbi:MAG: hypothetical protein ACYTFH_01620 [Planctomycetota bacterium]